jgi:hypothetical protein
LGIRQQVGQASSGEVALGDIRIKSDQLHSILYCARFDLTPLEF